MNNHLGLNMYIKKTTKQTNKKHVHICIWYMVGWKKNILGSSDLFNILEFSHWFNQQLLYIIFCYPIAIFCSHP